MKHRKAVFALIITSVLLAPSRVSSATNAEYELQTSTLRYLVDQLDEGTGDAPEPLTPAQATEAFEQARRAISTTIWIERSLAFQIEVSATTNPWSDRGFRNSYDRLSRWGTSIGTIAASIALVSRGPDKEKAAAAGLGLVGAAQLIGGFFGAQTGSKFESRAAFVEVTRRAYDDLLTQKGDLERNIGLNESIRTEILATHEDYKKAGADSPLQKAALSKLVSQVKRADTALEQIPAFFESYRVIFQRYKNQPGIDSSLRDKLDSLEAKVTELRSDFEVDVKGYLELMPRLALRLDRQVS